MEPLKLTGTEETPEIILDPSSCTMRITGKSLPEDAVAYYRPVIEWLDAYKNNPGSNQLLEVRLDYFNTASAKQLFKIISIVKPLIENNKLTIRWFYEEGDEDMEKTGKKYATLLEAPIEVVPY